MTFEVIADWETIYGEKFQQQWLQWVETAHNSHVFFHPALCLAWLDTYRLIRNLKPYFVIGKTADTTIFLPLVLWHRNWKNAFQKLLIPVGYSDFDYHDPLVVGNFTEMDSLHTKLFHFVMNTLPYDCFKLNGLRSQLNFDLILEEEDRCPIADLTAINTFDEAQSILKNKLLSDIKRQINRLEKQGELHFTQMHNMNDCMAHLPTLLNYHSKRWPNAYKAPKFHENLIKSALNIGVLDFSVLKLNNTVISYHLGFKYQKTFYYYMPCINAEYNNYSPGKVHLYFLFKASFEQGFSYFDHLRGDENYKNGWTNHKIALYCLNQQQKSMISKTKLLLLSLKNKLTS